MTNGTCEEVFFGRTCRLRLSVGSRGGAASGRAGRLLLDALPFPSGVFLMAFFTSCYFQQSLVVGDDALDGW